MSTSPEATYDGAASAPEARLGDIPPERRNGHARGMLPSTWFNRSVRLEYSGAFGPVETGGILLDFCAFGPVFLLAGARVLIAWDRICLIELVEG